jgi:hypothetical protein
MGEALQDYNLVFILKKQVDCCKKMFTKTKFINPNNNEWNEQENNNKQQDNANPTMQEMNIIQVDCCKKCWKKQKKSKTQLTSRE